MKFTVKSFGEFTNESSEVASKIQGILRNKYRDVIEKLFIFETGNGLELNIIRIEHSKRNKGWASKIMEDLIEYADQNTKIIHLTPTDDFGSDVDKLINFYKGFGFVENRGGNRNTKIKDSMYRHPTRDASKRVI